MPTESVRGFDGPEAVSPYLASPILTPRACLKVGVVGLKVSLLMGRWGWWLCEGLYLYSCSTGPWHLEYEQAYTRVSNCAYCASCRGKGGAGMDLDEAAVGSLLRMEEVVPAMERALADFLAARWCNPRA